MSFWNNSDMRIYNSAEDLREHGCFKDQCYFFWKWNFYNKNSYQKSILDMFPAKGIITSRTNSIDFLIFVTKLFLCVDILWLFWQFTRIA